MKLRAITEELAQAFKVRGDYVEILKNPTQKEMDSVSKEFHNHKYLRFIADGDAKTLYVFRPDLFHYSAIKKLGLKRKDNNTLYGTAIKKNGKWQFDGSDEDIPKNFPWKWLKSKGIENFEEAMGRSGLIDIKFMPEEFVKGVKYGTNYVELFKNPTAKEFKEVSEGAYFRFAAKLNSPGNVTAYIWNPDFLHGRMAEQIGLPYPISENDNVIYGVGRLKPKPTAISSFNLSSMDQLKDGERRLQKLMEKDWSNNYINFLPLFKMLGYNPKKKKKLSEEFKTGARYHSDYFEIFENPTSSELKNLPLEVRFIIDDKNKKIYVWDSDFLHYVVARKLDIPYMNIDKPDYLFGLTVNYQGKLKKPRVVNSASQELVNKFKKKDYWAKKYFG